MKGMASDVAQVWRDLWCGYRVAIPITIPVLIYVAIALALSQGELTYARDDAYIHIELAKHIFHGHYGINEGEITAPSSSVIWPFLLAPFGFSDTFIEWLPLLIGAVSAALTGLLVFRLFQRLGILPALAICLMLGFTLNIYGLILYGMEHGVQILLTAVVAAGLLNPHLLHRSRGHRVAFYAALAILPLLRYDTLALVLPVLAYQFFIGDRWSAVITGAVAGGTLAIFSGFLYANDLGVLPLSVTTKSRVFDVASALANLKLHLTSYPFMLIAVGLVCLSYWRRNIPFVFVLASFTALFFVFEVSKPTGRYEPFYLLFISIFALRQLIDQSTKLWVLIFICPIAFASTTYSATFAPLSAANSYAQQRQMGRLAKALDQPVAVLDLGLVALYTERPVLDLMGLASKEAADIRQPLRRFSIANQTKEDTSWSAAFMERHNVHFAMVYAREFTPIGWVRVGTLDLHQKAVMLAEPTVTMFASSPSHAALFRQVMEDFAASQTSKAYSLTIDPDLIQNDP